jgi:hypothetical protein
MISRQQFLGKIAIECTKNNITFILANQKNRYLTNLPCSCGGFFDNAHKTLFVSTAIENWFENTLHEYCHLQQSLEGKFNNERFEETVIGFGGWINNQLKLTPKLLTYSLNTILKCEHDCEKRTVNLIKQHPNWKINLKEYIQRANAYLCFYPFLLKFRNWDAPSPADFYEVYSLLPSSRIISVDKVWELCKKGKVRNAIKKHCFTKSDSYTV